MTIQLRGDTAANWTTANPVLAARQVGLETDTRKFKVGDGATAWSGLSYWGSAGTGTVTSVSVVTANGVSGSVATATTTPAITLTLGAITPSSVAASGTVTGSNLSGTNTGDQTTITGNAGTATALQTSRNFSISGGGITAAAVGFDGTAAVVLNASVDAGHITLARMANVATGTVFYRKTAGTGAPEVQTLATLKTDLGLTGTNSGDQTSIVGITGTLAEFNTALTGADFATGGGTATGTNTGDQTITLTGDVTGTGTGSFAATLATVNASPQTDAFRKVTVNAKGLVTATSAVAAADLNGAFGSQTAAFVYAAPAGAAGNPSFRALAASDVPTLNQNTTGSAATLTTSRDISMSGDVTWTVSFNGSANATAAGTIANDAVSNAKLANVATGTIKGRVTAATGDPEDLTGTQVTTLLDVATTSLKGLLSAADKTKLDTLDSVNWVMLTADYTLTSTTAAQKLFNTTTNGALTLGTGVYEFRAFIYIDAMSATSGNAGFNPVGGGTAVTDRWGQIVTGLDSTTPLAAGARNGSAAVTAATPNPATVAAVGTAMIAQLSGMFRVSTAGTIIPSVSLTTAAAAIVKAGSWFSVTRVGTSAQTSAGAWS